MGEWLSTQKAVSDAEKEFRKAALEVLSLLRALLGYNRSSVYELYWYTSAKKAVSDAEKELLLSKAARSRCSLYLLYWYNRYSVCLR